MLAVIADDEVNQIELIKFHLEKNNFKVLAANNGDDAFDLIIDNEFSS